MYEQFFSFREKPFKLVPNPAYLFLSRSHEETLANLNYALAEGDGFVEITGEVGTGKTTLCRTFLEKLDEDTIAAYIFNPRLGPRELIRTINDELGIKYDSDNVKDLIDKLNSFLIQQKIQRKKVILLIDEAQNLSRTVLEQLRLLSNLETSREKLLQIILVGQPELSDLLDSHELRQLSQRITLRYHLTPLNYKETVDYIKYRISIASQNAGINFSPMAFRRIYNRSQGIPRLINVVCDRSLLTAFSLGRHKINGSIVRMAITELAGGKSADWFGFAGRKKTLIVLIFLCIALAAAIYHRHAIMGIASIVTQTQDKEFGDSPAEEPEAATAAQNEPEAPDTTGEEALPVNDPDIPGISALPEASQSAEETLDSAPFTEQTPEEPEAVEPAPTQEAAPSLADQLSSMDLEASRYSALENAMKLWQAPIEFKPYLNSLDDDQTFFRLTASTGGLIIQRIKGNLGLLKILNLPAILKFYPTGSEKPAYLTLSKTADDKISFASPSGGREIETNEEEVNLYWSGVAYLPWKNFLSIWGTLPSQTNNESIIALKLLLRDLGYPDLELNTDFDAQTRSAVQEIQNRYGIQPDGVVGPLTKIILYHLRGSFDMPKLRAYDIPK